VEYRGYDSAGFAVADRGQLKEATSGKTEEPGEGIPPGRSMARMDLDIRMATMPPTEEECHPPIALAASGFVCRSHVSSKTTSRSSELVQQKSPVCLLTTDTEAVAHLIENTWANSPNLEDGSGAAQPTTSKGSFALAVMSADEQDK